MNKNNHKLALLVLGILFLSNQVSAAVFGVDNRELVEKNSPLGRGLGASVAIMIPGNFVTESMSTAQKKTSSIETEPLTDSWGMCSNERLAKVPSFFVSCTGFLIAPDILVTAGHCMVNFGEVKDTVTPQCESFRWLFDYQVQSKSEDSDNIKNKYGVKTSGISDDELYECEKVIHAVHDSDYDEATKKFTFRRDFAIVKLKNKTNRKPLNISKLKPEKGEDVSMIGYPLGGTQVFATGKVLKSEENYFISNLDAFDGNSGSPVFDRKQNVIGILVRGYPESLYEVKDRKNKFQCYAINNCKDDASDCSVPSEYGLSGEHVQFIEAVF